MTEGLGNPTPTKDYVSAHTSRLSDCDEMSTEPNEMLTQHGGPRKKGYDQIEYRATRFNNVTRLMHIPHPLPYARLCKCISENWKKLSHICENPNSQLKPAQHNSRILIMGEYEDLERISVMGNEQFPQLRFQVKISTGKFYRVEADISSCFPSTYTHSIPWALVGLDEAKANSRKHNLWYNKLDKTQRDLKRGETQGIPIGPATSHIISEIILYEIDETLCKEGYQFTRYIDDYKCYCETREQAENFILVLEQELRKYLLNLNVRKVLIEELPLGFQDQWVILLRNSLPSKLMPTPRDIMDFLNSAIELQKHYPDGSIWKYATRTLANAKKFDKNSASFFLEYLIAIAVHTPSVLPILCQIAKKYKVGSDLQIDSVLKQSIKFQRSDAICWCLYFMGICGQKVCDHSAKAIIETEDCMSMGMLIALNQHQEKVVDFLDKEINPDSEYDCDQYWILIHELAPDCPQFNYYRGESGLKFLRDKKVRFIKPINTKI